MLPSPPPDSQGPSSQDVRPRSAQVTQTYGNSSGDQRYLEATSELSSMQQLPSGALIETYHMGPLQPSLQHIPPSRGNTPSTSHALRPATHFSQASSNRVVSLSGQRTPSDVQHPIQREPLLEPALTPVPILAHNPAQSPAPIQFRFQPRFQPIIGLRVQLHLQFGFQLQFQPLCRFQFRLLLQLTYLLPHGFRPH